MVRRGLEGGWKWEVEAEQVHSFTEASPAIRMKHAGME